MSDEPLSWKIKTLRGQLVDLGSAIRQLQQSGLDSASAQLLISRKRAELEDLMNRTLYGTSAIRLWQQDYLRWRSRRVSSRSTASRRNAATGFAFVQHGIDPVPRPFRESRRDLFARFVDSLSAHAGDN